MTSINSNLVSVFQLLQKHDKTSNKFTKLANMYGVFEYNNKR